MFDDLIPAGGAQAPQAGGMFDDLIPKGPPAAPPQQSPTFSGTVKQGLAGFNEGTVAPAARWLVDAPLTLAARHLGGEPEAEIHPAENFVRHWTVDPAGPPQNGLERAVRAGGDMVGQNIALLGPASAAAGAGVRSGVNLAGRAAPGVVNTLRGAADSVLDWMAAHPVAAAASDTGAAFESGAGGETARGMTEAAGGSPAAQRIAETFGQLGTPAAISTYSRYAPTVLATKLAVKAADKGLGMVPSASSAERNADALAYSNREGKYADPDVPPPETNWATRRIDAGAKDRADNATQLVGKDFNEVLRRPEAAANLAEAGKIKAEIPGFNPGIAKETGDPALLNLQKQIEGEATGANLRDAQNRSDASTGAIRDYMDTQVPPVGTPLRGEAVGPTQVSKTPQDTVAAAASGRVGGITQKLGQQQENVRGQIRQVSDSLPEVDRAAAGDKLRDIRGTEQQAANEQVAALRKYIDPENVSRVQIGTRTAGFINPQEETVYGTVNNLLDERTKVLQELRNINSSNAKTPADLARRDALDAKLTKLNGFVDNLQLPDPRMQQRFEAFRNYYKNEYVPRFSEGASRNVGRYDQFGYDKNRVASEDVPGQFFQPNNISEARQFNKLYGQNPEARQAMTDYALDDLRHSSVDPNTGLIREGGVNRWMTKNERILNEMPWIRDAVGAKNPDQLYGRLGQLEQRQRAVADTKVAGLLGKNPEQHIDAALNDWQVMRGLRRSVAGDPQSEAALTRAVWDRASAAAGPDTLVDPGKLQNWIDGHRRALNEALSPQHIKSLETVITAARIQNRLPRPTGSVDQPATLADKTAGATGLSVQGYLSRFLNVAKGYMSKEYAAADIATRVWHNMAGKDVDAAWREALANPKVAENLASMVRGGAPTAIQYRRLYNHLLTVGAVDSERKD